MRNKKTGEKYKNDEEGLTKFYILLNIIIVMSASGKRRQMKGCQAEESSSLVRGRHDQESHTGGAMSVRLIRRKGKISMAVGEAGWLVRAVAFPARYSWARRPPPKTGRPHVYGKGVKDIRYIHMCFLIKFRNIGNHISEHPIINANHPA